MVFPWYSKLVSSFSWRFGSLQVHMALQNRQPAAGDNFDGERRRTRRTQGTQGTQRPWLHISRHCKITCIHMCIMYNICAYVYVCIYMYIYIYIWLCIYVCIWAYMYVHLHMQIHAGVDLNSFRRETTLLRQICRLAKLRQPLVFRRTHVGRYERSSQS